MKNSAWSMGIEHWGMGNCEKDLSASAPTAVFPYTALCRHEDELIVWKGETPPRTRLAADADPCATALQL